MVRMPATTPSSTAPERQFVQRALNDPSLMDPTYTIACMALSFEDLWVQWAARGVAPPQLDRSIVQTPLHQAARMGYLSAVQELVHQGWPLDLVDITGFTPLLCAAAHRQFATMQWLAEQGAQVLHPATIPGTRYRIQQLYEGRHTSSLPRPADAPDVAEMNQWLEQAIMAQHRRPYEQALADAPVAERTSRPRL